jgi:hypothetical protein
MVTPSDEMISLATSASGFSNSSMDGILPNKPVAAHTNNNTTNKKPPQKQRHKIFTERFIDGINFRAKMHKERQNQALGIVKFAAWLLKQWECIVLA